MRKCLLLVEKASWRCYRSIISIWVGLVKIVILMMIGKGRLREKVEACGRMSWSCEDAFLDMGIEKAKMPEGIIRQVVVMG